MGYKWTACELINNGKTLVIQSHGVTTGPWPGFKLSQFGNGHYYGSDIDGQDISSYNDKTQKLYDAIKDFEDTSATYGNGLYLISAEKAQLPTVIYGASGAGYYCDALVSAGSEGNPNGTHCNAWLGTLGNKENTAWFVNGFANGYIALQDDVVKTIAPAFNIDLSKVKISGDEIVKKTQLDQTNGFDFASMAVTTPSDNNLSANSNHTSMSAVDVKNLFKDFAERLPSGKFYEMSQNNSSIQPDDSAVENRKAQFIIAEQGIAELAGAVTAQSDSSKELTDSSQYRSIWEYGMDLTKDGETFHLDPEMVSQIYEAITEDNGRNYVATYTSRKFTREQYIAICNEVENLLTNDSVEYRACENVLGVGFDNYTGQPAFDNLPKKLNL